VTYAHDGVGNITLSCHGLRLAPLMYMTIGKLCLAAFLASLPAITAAQPSVNVDVNVGADIYATAAPGEPVESVDVFYDQLSPYGVWVDEPGVGRVFVPDEPSFVPYTRGHWQYTNVGFVWISTEPFAWATTHYGRWAFSTNYGRWYWLPDTEWGPAWVEWREVGDDFGWAPLAPEIVVRAGWRPPVEVWHYCGAEHVLDVNVTRFYEPRDRVIEIHRSARPIEHYATISNVKVVVGPPPTVLREHRVAVRPVRVEPRIVGRWSAGEARAQVERAREHRTTFEVQNQRRIESKPQVHTAQVKVIEAHPQIKAQVDARIHGTAQPEPNRGRTEPQRAEPGRTEPGRTEPRTPPTGRPEPTRTPPTQRPTEPGRAEPNRTEPMHTPAQRTPEPRGRDQRPAENPREHATPTPPPSRPQPPRAPEHAQPQQPQRPEPPRAEPQRPEPPRAAPQRPEPQRPEPQRAQPQQPQRPEPPRAEPQRPEPPRAAPQRPEPQRSEPQRAEPPRAEPQRAPERKEPARQPERREPDRKDGKDDRKEPDHR
jgi:hypothetical protein